jgi:transposase
VDLQQTLKYVKLSLKNTAKEKLFEILQILDVPKSTVGDIIKNYAETGELKVKGKSPGRPRIVTQRSQRNLIKICKKNRRNTLRDITAQWNDESGTNLSRECCRKWIHKSGLSFYKVQK